MDITLLTVKWQFASVYFDEIVVFLRSPRDHIIYVQWDLLLLRDA